MAVASNLTDISLCESLTNWAVTGGPTLALKDSANDGIPPIEGTYSLGGDVDIETGVYLYDEATALGVTQDYSGRHVYVWAQSLTASFLDTAANGGLRIVLEDSSGNQGYWYVGGKDTYTGGWARFVIDCDSTPTANNGTDPTITTINKIGFAFKAIAKSKITENSVIDLVQWGSSTASALTVTAGTSGTPLTWEDVYTGDAALAKPTGIIRKFGGVYFLQGPLEFGDSAGTADTYFSDSNSIVVWEDTLASVTYYDVTVTGNATGTTSFVLGAVSGSGDARFGAGGGVMTAAGLHKYTFDGETNTANIDVLSLYGVTFGRSGILQFDGTTTQNIISCTFDTCGQLQYNEANVLNCNFLNNVETTGAVEMLNAGDDNLRYCLFRQCTNGVYFPSGQTTTRDFVGLDFDDVGSKFDVNNASGSAVEVNNTAEANANSYTGSVVTFPSSVQLTMTVKDSAGNVVVGALAYIDDAANTAPFIMNTTTNASGIATTAWTGGASLGSYWRVRKYGYKPFKQTIDIGGIDISLPVTLVTDPQQV
jgi:hypothetical protein